MEDLRGLRPPERERLDRFARAFDRIDASAYIQLAEVVVDADVRGAQDAALALIGTGHRRDAVRAAVASFVDAATVAYSRRTSLTDTFLLNQSLPDRAEDRARLAASVERAVVGLILWDELDEEHIATLIGRWAPFVEAS
ncbi:MAG TPA: hypothetical protein VFP56_00830 [Candidatus Limnocylindrales bacterium]|nr:hypothetical protein [Candidatus Limnocylindrales bacterium]